MLFKKRKKKKVKEVLTLPRLDRRILSNVPDPENIRMMDDRRGSLDNESSKNIASKDIEKFRTFNLRYEASFDVILVKKGQKKKGKIKAKAVDISSTGLLIELNENVDPFELGAEVIARFNIPSGTMPEGFESKVKINATTIRIFEKNDKQMMAIQFEKPLTEYFQKKRWGYSVYTASAFLFVAVLFVMLLRVESIIYFKYNLLLYLYSLIAAAFLLTRYLFGAFYRDVPINPNYTPGVSIIIPCFNEEEWISRTILSCINQDYPVDKLEVIVVDDRSTDGTVKEIEKTIEMVHREADRFMTKERLKMHVLPVNGGKREALVQGVDMAKHDLVVFVDSDSFLDPSAIQHIVQPFQDPRMGGVAGRTEVENKFTNMLTKLQTVRYYVAFRIMKAAESWFDSVTCLSGPLSCYRKDLILKHKDAWLNQKFLGQPATFGDDRSMTNYILQTHRTGYQDQAVCSTIVPSDMNVFLKQQMRWKRSWLRESLRAGSFIWKKEPFMALFFYIGLIVPIAAPVVVLYNLVYVPLLHHIFPGTFLMGLLLMAMLMSLAHLFFRKSKLWVFGFYFCIFYEFVLLWQMPIAWFTFWKSTWGTRETPQDVEAKNKKEARKRKNKLSKDIQLPL
ncbi:glycosyltransferase family 2 protein [Rummeliibacillus sp. TYF005]|uniref:glycosyltransferase family 2 protein n=1 Tax=Rummeliibacillus sp. TYF005 TaxID=2058214 RepID=UPI000F53DED2|nr:glycosyltransferase [Rummeliibacillus sp. TYF005]RPJ94576.1 glycosyltransferase family 2 protein [Rummeliibacillus sp. TYF005]